ncbi:MAG: AAA family ATPase [Bacilli bacterium]|nr:AAA family ATPase [Bacilli bacterium]
MNNRKGKSIILASSKGGVGKTILTMNLAGIYFELGKKVLLIDMDINKGTIALNLNVKGSNTIFTLTEDLLNNRFDKLSNYVIKFNDNIDIIQAPKDPRDSLKIDSRTFESIITMAKNNYDIVLIDTPCGFDKNNIILMDEADVILYVMTNDFMDIKNTKSFMSIIKETNLENVKLVLNNSRDLNLNYFSNFDIRNIIKKNIDYTISESFYIKNITKYILEGEILILNKNLTFKDKRDYKKLVNMAKELINE